MPQRYVSACACARTPVWMQVCGLFCLANASVRSVWGPGVWITLVDARAGTEAAVIVVKASNTEKQKKCSPHLLEKTNVFTPLTPGGNNCRDKSGSLAIAGHLQRIRAPCAARGKQTCVQASRLSVCLCALSLAWRNFCNFELEYSAKTASSGMCEVLRVSLSGNRLALWRVQAKSTYYHLTVLLTFLLMPPSPSSNRMHFRWQRCHYLKSASKGSRLM